MAQHDVSEIAIGSDSYVLKDAQAREVKADQSDIAIIIDGNKTTHTGGAAQGDFVIVRNSTISGITDGLYTAAQAIPANTAIDSTYLTAVDGGGLNALNSQIGNLFTSEIKPVGSSSTSLQSLESVNTGWFNAPSGYYPISAVYIQYGGTLNFPIALIHGTGGQWVAIVTNTNRDSSTCYGAVEIIYIKTSAL